MTSTLHAFDRRIMHLRPVHRESGEVFAWKCWRDGRSPCDWVLLTHDGVTRSLAANWLSSVPIIRLIADNYGCDINVS